ncbi:hypothetical protein DL769_000213 [Monosporascus sp. CRB-8-3]|nr:hypothetical protein DL769_000213 [Monosporascus sp. CRB-8-3]
MPAYLSPLSRSAVSKASKMTSAAQSKIKKRTAIKNPGLYADRLLGQARRSNDPDSFFFSDGIDDKKNDDIDMDNSSEQDTVAHKEDHGFPERASKLKAEDRADTDVDLKDIRPYPGLQASSDEAVIEFKQPMNPQSSTGFAIKRGDSEPRSICHGPPSLGTSDTRVFDFDASGNRTYEHLQHPFNEHADLQVLHSVNRLSNGPGNGPLPLAFPGALMGALFRAHTGMSNTPVPTVGASRISVAQSKFYVCVEENNHVVPFFNIMGTTMDKRLINELALDRFRSAVHKHFPNLMDGVRPWEVEDEWINAEGDIRGMSKLAWWVDGDGCVTLSAAQPGTSYQMDIRVMTQTVTMRTHM